MPILALILYLLFQSPPSAPAACGVDFSSDEIGVSLTLPSAAWKQSDHGQGRAQVLVFSPQADISTRCSVLFLPVALIPDGLLTREEVLRQVAGEKYKRVSYGPAELAGRAVDLLVYTVDGHTTREHGLRRGDFYFIFQLAAPDEVWNDPAARAQLDGIRASLRLRAPRSAPAPEAARTTPSQIRSKRRAARLTTEEPFEILRHQVAVDLDPEAQSLRARDRLRIRSNLAGLSEIGLTYTHVNVEHVESSVPLSWNTRGAPNDEPLAPRTLTVEFAKPLSAGEELSIAVETASDDYFVSIDQQLVQEIAVVGQVRADSCFSSHIAYYPVDEVNDAAVELALTVPVGYTAVTGGDPLPPVTAQGRTTFGYRTDLRSPRALPFGFAAGKYIARTGQSRGGLNLTVYGKAGEAELIQQRVDVAVEAASIFERMMGPLPWSHVRFAHVTPERKETGVSLPGLILLSDGFFGDLSNVDLSSGNLNRSDVLDLLVVVDELSHQWNFYSVSLPNELAEGISSFTNALFVERRHGRSAYRKTIDFYHDAYLAALELDRDVAIADPAIYQTQAYRGIAFCKVPAVIDMLRSELGDELFFRSWRRVFEQLRGQRADFDEIALLFSEVAGRDLSWFFDQWFFRAGCPRIQVDHQQTGDDLTVTLRQTHDGEPYRLRVELLVRGAGDQTQRRTVDLHTTEAVKKIDCRFEVTEVIVDPGRKLLRVVNRD